MLPYVSIFGLTIPMYGLMFSIGLFFACLLAVVRIKKVGLAWEDFAIIAACAVGLGLAGSSVVYAFVTYPLSVIFKMIAQGEFAHIFGGAVFYGGMAGGGIGAVIGSKVAKVSLFAYESSVVPALPMAHAFGRVGCFCAGCCYGIHHPFGLAFTQPIGTAPVGIPLVPVQLIEAMINLIICGCLLLFFRKKRRSGDGILLYLSMYAISRFSLEFLRGDEIRGCFHFLSTSQWISLAILAGVMAIYVFRRKLTIIPTR